MSSANVISLDRVSANGRSEARWDVRGESAGRDRQNNEFRDKTVRPMTSGISEVPARSKLDAYLRKPVRLWYKQYTKATVIRASANTEVPRLVIPSHFVRTSTG